MSDKEKTKFLKNGEFPKFWYFATADGMSVTNLNGNGQIENERV